MGDVLVGFPLPTRASCEKHFDSPQCCFSLEIAFLKIIFSKGHFF